MIRPLGLAAALACAGFGLVLQPPSSPARADGASSGSDRGVPTPLRMELVASGLAGQPVFVTSPPGDFDRLFVVERFGEVRVLRDGVLQPTPYVDIGNRLSLNHPERGLLGLAFHPDFATNGRFYLNYTADGEDAAFGDTVVAEFQVDGDPMTDDVVANQTPDVVLTFDQPESNHNGGWMGFGPDGFLYITTGDGGGQFDPDENAQNRSNLLGSVLRIDVDADDFPGDASADYGVPSGNPFVGVMGVREEIWAFGLRNPFRAQFDQATGDLWLVDVGQNSREEINVQPAASVGGENYGWDCREGFLCTGESQCDCGATIYTDPIYDYAHVGGRCSITGAALYRGCAIPDLQGTFFFADYCTGEIWSLRFSDGMVTDLINRTSELGVGNLATSFGVDAYGEVYLCRQNGEVYKIVADTPEGFAGPDCNMNGAADGCDIRDGTSEDDDQSGAPDECEIDPCPTDFTGDDLVSAADLSALLGAWGTDDMAFDLDGSGVVGPPDLSQLLGTWGPCPTP